MKLLPLHAAVLASLATTLLAAPASLHDTVARFHAATAENLPAAYRDAFADDGILMFLHARGRAELDAAIAHRISPTAKFTATLARQVHHRLESRGRRRLARRPRPWRARPGTADARARQKLNERLALVRSIALVIAILLVIPILPATSRAPRERLRLRLRERAGRGSPPRRSLGTERQRAVMSARADPVHSARRFPSRSARADLGS